MEADAKFELPEGEVEAADGSGMLKPEPLRIYTGHLTSLFQKLELAMPYYTTVMKGLKALNCVEQLRRGGGTSQSKWVLLEAPTEQAWVDYEDNKRGGVKQGKVAMLEQQLAGLNSRIQAIEEYLAQGPDLEKMVS
jgi:hypothetical protein